MSRRRGNHEGSIVRRRDGLWMAQMTAGRDPQTGRIKRATFYAKTRREVAEKLASASQENRQGTFVAAHRVTLGEWVDTWLWEYKRPSVRPLTFDSYEMLVRKHLKPALGNIPLRDLQPEHVQRFYNEKAREGCSARTIRYLHTLLYGTLAQAEKNQLIARNIASLVKPPRKERKEMQTLTLQQVTDGLLPALTEDRLFAAVFLLFGTGLRRGELLALRWRDVNLETGVLHVRQTLARVRNHGAREGEKKTRLAFQEPKTAYSRRTVPIPEGCLVALRQHKARQAEERLLLGSAYEDPELVFCWPDGRPINPRHLNTHFDKILKRAGLPPVRLHDLRHTFATLMLELGESPKTVQAMLGHSSVAITLDIYSHVSLELEKKAASRLNAALTGEEGLELL
jgi:integrase